MGRVGTESCRRDAAEAQVLAQKGGVGKIILLMPDPPK